MSIRRFISAVASLFLVASIFGAQQPLGRAAVYTWNGSVNNNWENGFNWTGDGGFPDDPSDIANIQLEGAVVNTSMFLDVKDVNLGSASASAKLNLGADMTVDRIFFGSNAASPGNFGFDIGTHTINVHSRWQAVHPMTNTGFALANGTIRAVGNANLTFRFQSSTGAVILGDDAGDVITLSGEGQINHNGTITVQGQVNVTGFHRFNNANPFTVLPGGNLTSPVNQPAGQLTGVSLTAVSGNQTLPAGNFPNLRIFSEMFSGGSTKSLGGALTLGDLDLINISTGNTSVTWDTTAANHPLTITQNLRIGNNGTLNLRSSNVSLNDVLLDRPFVSASSPIMTGSTLVASNANISVSGNWDSSGASATSLQLGTSEVRFTGANKTLNTFAPNSSSHQSFADLTFAAGSDIEHLSDVYVAGDLTTEAGSTLQFGITAGDYDMFFVDGDFHAGGTIDIVDLGGIQVGGSYDLFEVDGAFFDEGIELGLLQASLPGNAVAFLLLPGEGQSGIVQLTIGLVPEPGTGAMFAVALLGAAVRRRRK